MTTPRTDARPEAGGLDELVSLLEHQLELMDMLNALAEEQHALVESAQGEALLGLLSRRQGIIDRFTSSQEDFGRLTDGLEERLEGADAARQAHVRSLLGRIGDGLAEVMSRDAADQAVLATRRDDTRRELRDLDARGHARKAYLAPNAPRHRFADRQG